MCLRTRLQFDCTLPMAAIPLAFVLPAFSHSLYSDSIEQSEGFEECNDLTVLDYGKNSARKNHWMTPHYLSLQLRCSGLMMNEAKRALRHHFSGECSKKLQKLPDVGKEIQRKQQTHQCLQGFEGRGNSLESYFGVDRQDDPLLPTFLALPIEDSEAVTGLLEESFYS